MNNQNDLWKKSFQDKLSSYQKPGADLSWAELEAGVKFAKKRRTLYYWLGAASIAAVVAIFFVSTYTIPVQRQKQDEVLLSSNQNPILSQQIQTPTLSVPVRKSEQLEAAGELTQEGKLPEKVSEKVTEKVSAKVTENQTELIAEALDSRQPDIPKEKTDSEKPAASTSKPNIYASFEERDEIRSTSRRNRIRVSTSIYAGNPWQVGENTHHDTPMLMSAPMLNTPGAPNKEFEQPVARPVLQSTGEMKTYEHYYQPIRYGLAVNFGAGDATSIGTGLYFSNLRSKTGYNHTDHESNEIQQSLWYIGLPLNVTYKFIDFGKFYAYTTLGGMAEVLMTGHRKTTILNNGGVSDRLSETDKPLQEKVAGHPWQFSANLAAGLGIGLTEKISIFAEPGVTYYFKNPSSDLKTFYTDNRFAFSLNLGFRFHFE